MRYKYGKDVPIVIIQVIASRRRPSAWEANRRLKTSRGGKHQDGNGGKNSLHLKHKSEIWTALWNRFTRPVGME